jgi:myo-inositol-1(or 4)-monophosphatase
VGQGVRDAVLPLAGTEAGREEHEVGAGGDTTLELDRAAEAVVFSTLGGLAERGERFSVLSEETGRRNFGAEYPLVLVDPVDGSLNAKQGVPIFGLMLAVLDGPAVADAFGGLVLNLSTGESWTATRNEGMRRNGRLVDVLDGSDHSGIELLALESTPRAITVAKPLVERATKLRILGSMALSIAHTAAGGFDAFCAPLPVRMFDTAASLLMLAEAGGVATDLEGRPVGSLACSLETRSTLLCAPSAALHAAALETLARGR